MRQLTYSINLSKFKKIKQYIVPTLFTEHQFNLIEKKFTNKILTDSEKNEFSRTISRKMNAINKITGKDTFFIYGKNHMINKRLNQAKSYLKKFERKFKNKHIIISGSFLYKSKFNDIDIFVISKYEKEDYKTNNFHVNYLTEDVVNSLFFASLKKLCISNKEIQETKIREDINLNTFISIYQELFNDLEKQFVGIKTTLREFLLQAAFIENSPIPNSSELNNKIDIILTSKNKKQLIKKIFVNAIILNKNKKEVIKSMKNMIESYHGLIKEYKQHRLHYLDLIQSFKEVIELET